MGKRRHTHETEDQFGEVRSQDRDEPQHLGRGGHRGGGSAGGSRRGADLSFERHVPKFLQPYAHMLNAGKQQQEDEPIVVDGRQQQGSGPSTLRPGPGQDSDDDDDDNAEAIARALEDNPELAAQLGAKVTAKLQAAQEKEAGNKAFGEKRYEEAVQHFSKCVELDPGDAVFYSNRSAALACLSRFTQALEDADAAVRRKPSWVKGHARRAAALYGLKLYAEAREAYEAALKLEPDDQALQRGRDKALGMEMQNMRDNKHVFKRVKTAGAGGGAGGGGAVPGRSGKSSSRPKPPAAAAAGVKDKTLLSFGGDEDEEGGV